MHKCMCLLYGGFLYYCNLLARIPFKLDELGCLPSVLFLGKTLDFSYSL